MYTATEESDVDQSCKRFLDQLEELEVKSVAVETEVDQSCKRFLDQFEVLEVKRPRVENPEETSPSKEDTPGPPAFVKK